MTNTKLCSECRHGSTHKYATCDSSKVNKRFEHCVTPQRFHATVLFARAYDLLCGKDGKHYEPIGGDTE